jgi:hypothetical protein
MGGEFLLIFFIVIVFFIVAKLIEVTQRHDETMRKRPGSNKTLEDILRERGLGKPDYSKPFSGVKAPPRPPQPPATPAKPYAEPARSARPSAAPGANPYATEPEPATPFATLPERSTSRQLEPRPVFAAPAHPQPQPRPQPQPMADQWGLPIDVLRTQKEALETQLREVAALRRDLEERRQAMIAREEAARAAGAAGAFAMSSAPASSASNLSSRRLLTDPSTGRLSGRAMFIAREIWEPRWKML